MDEGWRISMSMSMYGKVRLVGFRPRVSLRASLFAAYELFMTARQIHSIRFHVKDRN